MEEDVQQMIYKFKNSILFYAEVNGIDLNFLDIQDLKNLESAAYQLQIAISGFDLERYESGNDSTMLYFIFETWQKEAQIAMEVAEQVLKNFMEENL